MSTTGGEGLLYDPERHEPLRPFAGDGSQVGAFIERIVRDTDSRFSADTYWPNTRDLRAWWIVVLMG